MAFFVSGAPLVSAGAVLFEPCVIALGALLVVVGAALLFVDGRSQ